MPNKAAHEEPKKAEHENPFRIQWRGSFQDQKKLFNGQASYKKVKPGEQFDVDTTILDYLVHKACISLINAREAELRFKQPDWEDVKLKLEMAHTFVSFVSGRMGVQQFPEELSYRLSLLQLICLFTCRLHTHVPIVSEQSLEALKQTSALGSNAWLSMRPGASIDDFDTHGLFPLPRDDLIANRSRMFSDLRLSNEIHGSWVQETCGGSTYLPLRLFLGPFLEFTVIRAHKFDQWTGLESWLDLTAELMLQATIESYLLLGEKGSQCINEIFAFGALGRKSSEDVTLSFVEIQSLFCQDREAVNERKTWTKIRNDYIEALTPMGDGPWPKAMQQASEQFPLFNFELKMLSYLRALQDEPAKPDLQQIEDGVIDGVTAEESNEIFERIGLRR